MTFLIINNHYPKSLVNEFGLKEIFPVIKQAAPFTTGCSAHLYGTYCVQVKRGVLLLKEEMNSKDKLRLLITGGGAHNRFLTERLKEELLYRRYRMHYSFRTAD